MVNKKYFGEGFKATIFRKVSNDFEKYLRLLEEEEATDTFKLNIEKVFVKLMLKV